LAFQEVNFVGSPSFHFVPPQLCYSVTVKTDVIFPSKRQRSLLVEGCLVMSRIDVFGDRICIVSSLLIVGWFLYSIVG
jgi:hypothetical protein